MVELRDATPADAHAIATLHVQLWRAAYHGLLPDGVLARLSVSDREQLWAETLAAQPPNTHVVVATVASKIVGFAATGPTLVPADRAEATLGELYALYLHPEVWRRGIGTQLHVTAIDCLQSCGFIHAYLWVLISNERAIRFYYRHGWTDIGRTQVDQGPGGIELHERRLHRTLISEQAGEAQGAIAASTSRPSRT